MVFFAVLQLNLTNQMIPVTVLCIIRTDEADDCSDGQILGVALRGHAALCVYPHCDVLIGRDTVGQLVGQLQHRGYRRVVGAHTHHPMAIIKGLSTAGSRGVRFE